MGASNPYPLGRRRTLIALAGLTSLVFLASVSHGLVVPALPRIVAEMGGVERFSWLLSSYLLPQAVSVALWGRLSDLHGRRPVLLAALVCFLAGCVVAGLAPSFEVLLAGRVVQGLGAGGILTVVMAAIADLLAPRLRAKWQGLISGAVLVSALIGPTLGGAISDALGWRWVFFAAVPLTLAGIAVTRVVVTGDARRAEHAVDYVGASLLACGLACGLLAVGTGGHEWSWGSAPVLLLAAAAAVLLVLFGWWERRVADPVVPLVLFRNPTFAAAQVGIFTVGAAIWTTQAFVPLVGQGAFGLSAARSGAFLLPFTIATAVSGILVGQLVSRTGRLRPALLACPLVLGAGFALLAQPLPERIEWRFVLGLVVAGAGAGIGGSMFGVAVQNAVPTATLGVASGANHFSRVLGGILVLPLIGSVFAARLQEQLPESARGRLRSLDVQAVLADEASASSDAAAHVREAFATATPTVFLLLLPLVALAFLGVLLAGGGTLRTTNEPAPPVGAALQEK